MKKKKIIPLVSLLVVLVVLVVAYVLLLDYNERKAAEEAANSDVTSAIQVTDLNTSDVKEIYYASEENEMTLSLVNSSWVIPGDGEFPVNQSVVSKMVSGVATLSASRTVDEGELADYGLDEPKLTVKLTCESGKIYELFLGDVNSYNDNTYLLYNDTVYMVTDTLTDLYNYGKDTIIMVSDSFPGELDADSVKSVSITNVDGKSNVITDADGLSKIVADATKYINFKKWSGYGLEEDELADYGITGESPQLTFEYGVATSTGSTTEASATYSVIFGTDADGNCFYTTPGSNMTYSIAKADYDVLMSYVYYAPATATTE